MRKASARLWVTLAAAALPAWATASYVFTTVDYPGASLTELWGMNDAGVAVGDAMIGNTQVAFTWNAGTFTLLPPAPGGVFAGGLGINNAGVIAGSVQPPSGNQGFVLNGTTYSTFAEPGSAQTDGRGIGDSGIVLGYSTDAGGGRVPFIYDPATNTFTNILIPGMDPTGLNLAQDVNAAGQVVGQVRILAQGNWGFVRDAGGNVTLFQVGGLGTGARGINDAGTIVGLITGNNTSFVGSLGGGFDPFLFPGAPTTYAEGINNFGEISGSYVDAAGVQHGFVAVSVPEPATLALLCAGIAGIGFARRRAIA